MTSPISKTTITLAFAAGAFALTALEASAAAPAQAATPAAAATPKAATAPAKSATTGKLYQDWGVECEAQADKSKKCFIQQNQFAKSGQRLLNVNVGYIGPKREPMIVTFLPLGLDLKKGAWVKLDPGPQIPLSIETCMPQGCRATALLDPTAVNSLRAAKTFTVWFKAHGDERQMNIQISVKGLPAAFAALK